MAQLVMRYAASSGSLLRYAVDGFGGVGDRPVSNGRFKFQLGGAMSTECRLSISYGKVCRCDTDAAPRRLTGRSRSVAFSTTVPSQSRRSVYGHPIAIYRRVCAVSTNRSRRDKSDVLRQPSQLPESDPFHCARSGYRMEADEPAGSTICRGPAPSARS